MYLIDNSTAVSALPTPAALGTAGYFTDGSAGAGEPATILPADFMNMLMLELTNVVTAAGLTPSKTTYNQLLAAIKAIGIGQVTGVVGDARNLKCVQTTAGTSLTYTADQIIAATALNGLPYLLPSFNQTLNGSTTGIGGLDTGALAASSFYSVYAALNPTIGTQGIFAQLEPSGGATTVYGGAHQPAGYTATALIGVWPTNGSSQFIVASQYGRKVNFSSTGVLTGSGPQGTPTSFSIAGVVPKCTKFVAGGLSITVSAAAVAQLLIFDQVATGASSATVSNNTTAAGGNSNNFPSFPVLTPQTLWYSTSTSGGAISNFAANLTQYEF